MAINVKTELPAFLGLGGQTSEFTLSSKLIAIAIALISLLGLSRTFRKKKHIDLPGPHSWPIFGNLLQVRSLDGANT
jgi:hypothetical protein